MHIPPPVIALLAVILLVLIDWSVPGLSYRLPAQVAGGVALCLAGAAVTALSARRFFATGTTIRPDTPDKATTLVTTGLFRISRNPMYLGMALFIAGAGLWLGTVLTVVVLAGFVGIINRWQILPEERALGGIFGEDHAAYMRRVRRWI